MPACHARTARLIMIASGELPPEAVSRLKSASRSHMRIKHSPEFLAEELRVLSAHVSIRD